MAGNHDGYGRGDVLTTTLDGWRENFLGQQPPEKRFPYRDAMNLPFVFWMLETPVANIIGLYSNTEGLLDDPKGKKAQQDWLAARLEATPKSRPVLVMVHHPAYSMDDKHHGAPVVGDAIDAAAKSSGRWPDAVFSGHVHAYERFTRRVGNREIPYVVAGAGGRVNERKKLSRVMKWEGKPEITLPFKTRPRDKKLDVEMVAADWSDPGYLTVSVDATELRCHYWRVPFDEEQPVEWQDAFVLNFASHRITPL